MLSIKYAPKWIKILFGILLILLPALFMTFEIMNTQGVRCSVCIDYRGRSDCKEATASSKKDCLQTAVDNACALISSGMTESIQCANTPPSKIKYY
ncbi:MAG: hypothetical protein KDD48_06750 [Bdellovibrionales bacterium]|nr:hypothetical protein [Bdellovibrionales bacterium]